MTSVNTQRNSDARKAAAAEVKKIFDSLSDEVLLDAHQTSAVLGVSVASLKLWRQLAQHGHVLRGPKPLILAGSLVRYRTGDIRECVRSLGNQQGMVSSRGLRLRVNDKQGEND
jgi:hypothetical protein